MEILHRDKFSSAFASVDVFVIPAASERLVYGLRRFSN